MFIYIISPFLSFVRCDAIVSFRSPRRCLYVYWVKWGLICYLLKTFSFVSLDEFQPLSPWSCPMSIFFLWNSARHFFHHGLCDLRSSCRISMHQLGCQDLWHTYTQIENGNGNANKTTARKKKCGRFLNCYNWWSKILSSAAWNRNRTIIEIIKNSLKTFFKLEREWKRIGMLDLI